MWRPGLKVATVIIVAGWLAAPPLRAAQDEGDGRSSRNLEGVSAPGPESNTSRTRVPPSLRLMEASRASGVRTVAVGSAPPAFEPRLAPRPALLIGMYVSYGLLQALDAQSTIRALNSGSAHEGNPALSPFAAHPAALAAFKLGLTGGTIYGFDRVYKSHHRLTMIALTAVNGGYAYVVRRNYRSFPTR